MQVEEYIVRILMALILGYAIGFERKLRYNDAGPRTHAMVSMGACVFMLVSLYGFPEGTHDTSRVAASIVTGISFLGAGNIVYNRGNLHGLTTAAGIWVTAGIGMCAGSGMIKLSVIATFIVVIFQIMSHIRIPYLSNRNRFILKITYSEKNKNKFDLQSIINYNRVLGCKFKREEDEIVTCITVLINSYKMSIEEIVGKLNACNEITAIEFLDKK